jgi:hypothetical protein
MKMDWLSVVMGVGRQRPQRNVAASVTLEGACRFLCSCSSFVTEHLFSVSDIAPVIVKLRPGRLIRQSVPSCSNLLLEPK